VRTLHFGLRATDPDRALAFYAALGYEVVGRVPDSPSGQLTMLKLPGDDAVSVELVVDALRADADPGTGLNHFVISTTSMSATVADLRAKGVEVTGPVSPAGSEDFLTAWISDPDGNRIELVQWPSGHADGLTAADWALTASERVGDVTRGEPDESGDRADPSAPDVSSQLRERSAEEVVAEMHRRQQAGDPAVLDDLVAADLVNHAAGPQGREGLRRILRTIEDDLGPVSIEQHHLIGNGDLVVQHLTLHGTHRASSMPLLASISPSSRSAAWTFIHIWRVADGMIVEHWACRDDMGLVEQLRD
jgi:catechol 2,3-dioxygenase-like lactoylglutathione lyase family enzyme/predicted ester cyclase